MCIRDSYQQDGATSAWNQPAQVRIEPADRTGNRQQRMSGGMWPGIANIQKGDFAGAVHAAPGLPR